MTKEINFVTKKIKYTVIKFVTMVAHTHGRPWSPVAVARVSRLPMPLISESLISDLEFPKIKKTCIFIT